MDAAVWLPPPTCRCSRAISQTAWPICDQSPFAIRVMDRVTAGPLAAKAARRQRPHMPDRRPRAACSSYAGRTGALMGAHHSLMDSATELDRLVGATCDTRTGRFRVLEYDDHFMLSWSRLLVLEQPLADTAVYAPAGAKGVQQAARFRRMLMLMPLQHMSDLVKLCQDCQQAEIFSIGFMTAP